MTTERIHIVPSFHYDVAYLKPYAEYLPVCFRNIDEALRILDEHDDYRFLLEQVILLDEYWRAFPDKRAMLKRFAKEGRLDVAPGMWVMPDMNMPDGESMFLQARLGKQWLRDHLDIDPTVCWIADCWGHHAQLPQILRQCGYEYYVFWRCMRRDVLRNDFVWRGLDGTAIRAHWLSRGYGNLRFPTDAEAVHALEINFAGCSPREIRQLLDAYNQYGTPREAFICNGGDFAFPQAGAPDVLSRLNATGELPPMAFATPTEVLAKIDWAAADTFDGEFNSALQGTFTSNIRIKQYDRSLRNQLLALEALAVALGRPLPQADDLWKPVLKQQFHDILCGTITDAALEDCYREYSQAAQAITAARQALLADRSTEMTAAWFNALSFARREIIHRDGNSAVIDLPACGFAAASSATPLPASTDAALPAIFESETYTAHLDARGFITKLITRHDSREISAHHPRAAFGQIILQMDYGDLWLNFESPLSGGSIESSLTQNHPDPLDRRQPGQDIVGGTQPSTIESARIVHHSREMLVIEQRGHANFWRLKVPFTTRIALWRQSPRIDYETSLVPTGRHFRLRAAFPTSMAAGRRRDEIPFGLQPREVGEHVAQTFIDYSDAAGGLALINDGTPASNVADGIMLLTLFRSAAMEYKAESEKSFNEGVPHSFRYAVMAHDATDDAMVQVVRQAHAFAMPPMPMDIPAPVLGRPTWAVDAKNVLISGLRPHGDGVFVRLYEVLGRDAGKVRLSVPPGYNAFTTADGLERATGASDRITDGVIMLSLKPFEVKGLLIRR